ncbi:unnamed protein product, partial [Staurois parvus]
ANRIFPNIRNEFHFASTAKSVSAESSAISDSSLTVSSHLQRLKHCICFRIKTSVS